MMIFNFNPDSILTQSKDFFGASETEQPDAEFASLLAGFCGATIPQQTQQFDQTLSNDADEPAPTIENITFETPSPANLTQQLLPLDLPRTELSVSLKPLLNQVENKHQTNNFDLPFSQSDLALPKVQSLLTSVASELQNLNSTVSSKQNQEIAFSNDQIDLHLSNPDLNLSDPDLASLSNLVASASTIANPSAVSLPQNAALANNNGAVDNNSDLPQPESIEVLDSSTVVKTIDSPVFQFFKTNFVNLAGTAASFEVSRFKPVNLSLKNTFAADESSENLEPVDAEILDVAKPTGVFDLSSSVDQQSSDIKIQQLAPAHAAVDATANQPSFNFDRPSIDKTETSIENAKNVFAELLSNQQPIAEKTAVKSTETPILHVQLENPLVELAAKIEHLREPQTVKIRLRPEELGTVEIKLERAATGELKAHLQTETETARQIIADNLPHLHDALQQSGFKVERLDVSCNTFTDSNLGNNSEQSAQERKFENYIDDSIDADSPNGESNNSSIDPNRLLSVRA